MVKRILALSLLMVGLVACGSGGGASAEADTLNTTNDTKCYCRVELLPSETTTTNTTGGMAVSGLPIEPTSYHSEQAIESFGCINYKTIHEILLHYTVLKQTNQSDPYHHLSTKVSCLQTNRMYLSIDK